MIVPSVERSRIGIRWLAAALILAAITGASLTPGTAQAQPVEDLALHRPTTVSSATPNHPGSFAVDGEDHTFWQPKEDGPPAAFVVHLERNRPVDRVLLPRHPGVDSLVVEAWTGSAWTQVFSGETGNQVLFGFETVSTDRLRLLPRGEEPRLYEVEVYAVEPQPVFVNQSGYNLQWPKRFTAPRAENGASFEIRRADDEEVLFRGAISGHVGDFSSFRPEDEGPYEILVEGKEGSGRSVPFMVGPHWMERVSYGPALDFMADVRCWWGDARTYAPTDEDPDCPSRGVAWRDATQYSFEVPTLVWMYLANPSAFSPDRMPVEGAYLGLRKDLPEDTPEIVRLIYWGVDVYLRGEVDHALLKEQLAYFVYAYPHLSEYIPQSVYEEARDYLFRHWEDPKFERWEDEDFGFGPFWTVEHTANLSQTYTQIGTGKGQFPPGHSVVPNLLMYEVAQREGRNDAERFFQAAHEQTRWMIDNLDWNDPHVTKGQRMSEHVTMEGLAYFLEVYPERAPSGLRGKIRAWAEVMVDRSQNMWDFRRFSDDQWVIPNIRPKDHPSHETKTGFNEPGNVAGFAAPALAAVRVLEEGPLIYRLRELAMAQLDNVFGRNPTGRHFSYDAETDFEGVEQGWFKEYQGGAAQLQSARGVLDGSPKETTYPYDPHAGDPDHTEGWVAFNTAWNASLAYLSASGIELAILDSTFHQTQSSVRVGHTLGFQLVAPLNMDDEEVETGTLRVTVDGDAQSDIQVVEEGAKSSVFRAAIPVRNGEAVRENPIISAEPGDTITVSYGYGPFAQRSSIEVVE